MENDIETYLSSSVPNWGHEHLWEQLIAYRFPLLENIQVDITDSQLTLSYTGSSYNKSEIKQFIEETNNSIRNR